MHQPWNRVAWVSVLFFLSVSLTSLAFPQSACEQIKSACTKAGFVQGGVKSGRGLMVDCIQPIMQGTAQPSRASHALPFVDPQLIAACRAQNPNFGNPKGPASAPQTAPPVAAPSGPPSAPASWNDHPNIVFVLTDDLSLNLLQFMPHVLQMQKDGLTFVNYFVTDSLCCPSRSSIFTGGYPHTTGIFKNQGEDGGFNAYEQRGLGRSTFATALSGSGYRTAMMGKYLNGYLPERHAPGLGWSTWAVAGNGYGEFNYSLNEGDKVVRYDHQTKDYLTDVLSKQATEFIKQKKGQAFLLEVATFAPHAPYTPAPRDENKFSGLRVPRTPAYDAPPEASAPRWLRSHPALTSTDMSRIDQDFRKRAQSVQAVDEMIGELQKAVKSIGQEKNTYFVFSSDNGYHMGDFRLMPGKMTAYDTDIHVPLVITGPGVPGGKSTDAIVQNIDLCPTFTELGGASTVTNVDGHSLISLLHGDNPTDWRNVTLVEHHGPRHEPDDPDAPGPRSGNPPTYEAIRTQTFLYVEYTDGDREYHDLVNDKYELHNTYSSLTPERKSALHAAVIAIQGCHGTPNCWAAQHLKPEAQERR